MGYGDDRYGEQRWTSVLCKERSGEEGREDEETRERGERAVDGGVGAVLRNEA